MGILDISLFSEIRIFLPLSNGSKRRIFCNACCPFPLLASSLGVFSSMGRDGRRLQSRSKRVHFPGSCNRLTAITSLHKHVNFWFCSFAHPPVHLFHPLQSHFVVFSADCQNGMVCDKSTHIRSPCFFFSVILKSRLNVLQ